MDVLRRGFLAILVCFTGTMVNPGPALAQLGPPSGSQARTNFVYDRFGHLQSADTRIVLNNGDVWQFVLPVQFLNLPLRTQINVLDARYGLGWDRQQVFSVLSSIQGTLQQQRIMNQQQQLQNMLNQQQQLQNMLNQRRLFQPPPPVRVGIH